MFNSEPTAPIALRVKSLNDCINSCISTIGCSHYSWRPDRYGPNPANLIPIIGNCFIQFGPVKQSDATLQYGMKFYQACGIISPSVDIPLKPLGSKRIFKFYSKIIFD